MGFATLNPSYAFFTSPCRGQVAALLRGGRG
jgi:hypothetical protein